MKKIGKSILKTKIPYDDARRATDDKEYGREGNNIIIPTDTEVVKFPQNANLNLVVVKEDYWTTKFISIKYAKTTTYSRKLHEMIEVKGDEEIINTFCDLIEQYDGKRIGQRVKRPDEKNIYFVMKNKDLERLKRTTREMKKLVV